MIHILKIFLGETKLINNEINPMSREDISVLEFRDVIKTVNSAYEDVKLCSQTILELHGYLHRYSLIRGGRYRNEEINIVNSEHNQFFDYQSKVDLEANIEKNIKKDIENICQKYYELMNEDEIQDLIIIASFIIDFIFNRKFFSIRTLFGIYRKVVNAVKSGFCNLIYGGRNINFRYIF